MIKDCASSKVESLRVRRMKHLAHVGSCVSFMTLSFIVWSTLTEKKRWMTSFQDTVAIIYAVVLLSMSRCECIVHDKMLSFWYAVLILLASLFLVGAPSSYLWWRHSMMMAGIFRLITSFSYLYVPWILFCNVLYFVASFYTFQRLATIEGLHEVRFFVMIEGMLFLLLLSVCTSASCATWSAARRDVVAVALKGETDALTTLLNWVCEVVVDLDAELRICEDAPRLAGMLMLGSRRQKLRGSLLQDFMPFSDDRSKFEQQILAEGAGESSAVGAMHVKLSDSLSNHISVEIFYVHYLDLGGKKRLRLGIREFADNFVSELRGPTNQPQQRRRKRKHVFRGTQPVTVGCPLQNPSAAVCVEGPSASSDEESKSASASEEEEEESSTGAPSASNGAQRRRAAGGAALDLPSPTTQKAKATMIAEAMSMWHTPSTPDACCEFHRGVAQVQAVVRKMEKYTCASGGGISSYDAQCTECGVLMAWDGRRTDSRSRMQTCGVCLKQTVARLGAAGGAN